MISPMELIAILIAAFFLFGPKKLPELARSLGSAIGEFKKAQRAAELELTTFDAYTRKSGSGTAAGAKEEEKEIGNLRDRTGADLDLKNSLEASPSVQEKENPRASDKNEKAPGN